LINHSDRFSIGRITYRARPSVSNGLLTQKQKVVEESNLCHHRT